jgi:hypothetical protein
MNNQHNRLIALILSLVTIAFAEATVRCVPVVLREGFWRAVTGMQIGQDRIHG